MTEPTRVLAPDDVQRAITRMAHEIIERNRGLDGVVLMGIQRGGLWLAQRIAEELSRIDRPVACGALDVTMFRDDIGLRPVSPGNLSVLPVDVDAAIVVLVDDVLFTGRTVRAALDALNEYGRPQSVQLAVLIDRGHRELPLRPDFVGKNLPTARDESVRAGPGGVWLERGGER